MKGDRALYTEQRDATTPDDGREIVMEGKHARYLETTRRQAQDTPICEKDSQGLDSKQAKVYWQRLRAAGFVDDNCMLLSTTTRQQTWYIAELFAEKLNLTSVKWKTFQDFWNIKNLAQEKQHAQDTGVLPSRFKDIDEVFGNAH